MDEILLFLPTAEIDPSVESPPLAFAMRSFRCNGILLFQVELKW